jgi:NTP pyrophosphatase (non-canonical NTP hydrolase)
MYNNTRTYVYNKALAEADLTAEGVKRTPNTSASDTIYDNIREWATTRGLYKKGDLKTQYCKLGEEFGELGRAIIKDDKDEIIDAIGDMVVVLTNVAELANMHFTCHGKTTITLENCLESAYKVISQRKGKMVNGSFVKDSKPEASRFVQTTTL